MRFQQSSSATCDVFFTLATAFALARAQMTIGPFEQTFRAERVTLLLQRHRQVNQRLGMLRVEIQCLAVVLSRLAHSPGGIVQQPDEMISLGRRRLDPQVLFAAFQSLDELALVCEMARLLDPMFGCGDGRLCRCRFGLRLGNQLRLARLGTDGFCYDDGGRRSSPRSELRPRTAGLAKRERERDPGRNKSVIQQQPRFRRTDE